MTVSKRAAEIARKVADLSLNTIDSQISPFGRVPYPVQLEQKHSLVKGAFDKVLSKLSRLNFNNNLNNLSSELDIYLPIASPKIFEYRNKDEFSIWPGKDGKGKVVGFLSGSLKNSATYCIPATNVFLTKDSHKLLAAKFQEYLENVSPYGICTHFDRPEGNWRRLIVRSTKYDHLMMITVFHPKDLLPISLLEEKERLVDFFQPLQSELKLTSLYFQACRRVRCNRMQAPYQLLFGEKFLQETLNGIHYRISPDSFFQINSYAAEILCDTVKRGLILDKDTVVLDLFSGVGTFSLQVAPEVAKVFAIEEVYQAVQDANHNAQINGIKNCIFIQGNVIEKFLEVKSMLPTDKRLVVIVNPPRNGLDNSLITMLRETHSIDQLAFISCNPTGDAVDNLVHLCRPFLPAHEILGRRFWIEKAVPVDMFPHTSHIELVTFLKRSDDLFD